MHYVDKGTNNETNLLEDENTSATNGIEDKRTNAMNLLGANVLSL